MWQQEADAVFRLDLEMRNFSSVANGVPRRVNRTMNRRLQSKNIREEGDCLNEKAN